MDSNTITLKCESHNESYLNVLSSIRQSSAFSDATIACDGRFYNVHKLVMSSCSEYLKTVFESVDQRGTPMTHPVIIIHGVAHHHMEALLDYMYLGKVNVLQTELTLLMKAAEILQIKGLAKPDSCNILGSNANENKRKGKDLDWTNKKSYTKELNEKKYKNITNRFEKVKDEQDSFNENYQNKSLKIDVENSGDKKAVLFAKMTTAKEKLPCDIPDKTSTENELQNKNNIESSESKCYSNTNTSHLENHPILSEHEKSSSSKNHELGNSYSSTEPNVDPEIQYEGNLDNKTPSKHDKEESNLSPGGPIEAIDLWLQLKSNKGHINGVNCPLCTKYCGSKGMFLTHYKTHTGDKPYACPHCPRRFMQSVSQQNHIKTHTGARRFACPLCPRRFIQRKNLKNHIATHSRKKVLMYKDMGNL